MSAPKYTSALDRPETFPSSASLQLPTYGPPGDSPEVGMLYRETSCKQFRVFGNPRLRRYYVLTPCGAKVELCVSRHLPLYNGDKVTVPGEQGMWVFQQHGVAWY